VQVYLNRGGEQAGPYTMEQVQRCLAEGSVQPEDLAWHEGLPKWVPVSELAPDATPKILQEKTFFTLKRVVVGSVIWFITLMFVSAGLLYHVHHDSKTRRERIHRAGLLGKGMGTLTVIGWACLWLPWAYRYGKRKREERDCLAK